MISTGDDVYRIAAGGMASIVACAVEDGQLTWEEVRRFIENYSRWMDLIAYMHEKRQELRRTWTGGDGLDFEEVLRREAKAHVMSFRKSLR